MSRSASLVFAARRARTCPAQRCPAGSHTFPASTNVADHRASVQAQLLGVVQLGGEPRIGGGCPAPPRSNGHRHDVAVRRPDRQSDQCAQGSGASRHGPWAGSWAAIAARPGQLREPAAQTRVDRDVPDPSRRHARAGWDGPHCPSPSHPSGRHQPLGGEEQVERGGWHGFDTVRHRALGTRTRSGRSPGGDGPLLVAPHSFWSVWPLEGSSIPKRVRIRSRPLLTAGMTTRTNAPPSSSSGVSGASDPRIPARLFES